MKPRLTSYGRRLQNSVFGSKYPRRFLCIVFAHLSGISLKNHGVDLDVDQMFEMGAETMRLSMEEKMRYEQGDDGMSFG